MDLEKERKREKKLRDLKKKRELPLYKSEKDYYDALDNVSAINIKNMMEEYAKKDKLRNDQFIKESRQIGNKKTNFGRHRFKKSKSSKKVKKSRKK